MQVTIIPVDNLITVDKEPLLFPYEAPENVHAIQWKTDKGHIEYTDGKMNKELSGNADYLVHVLPYVDLWEQEKVRLEKELSPKPTFDELYTAKYAEIINGANAVKSALSRKYSDIEEQTWPQQEAGARAILGFEARCKDETARVILKDEEGRKAAIALVGRLAEAGNTTPEEFAQRIIDNADTAYNAGIQTLFEQQAYETALKAVQMSGNVAKVEAIVVEYSVVAG